MYEDKKLNNSLLIVSALYCIFIIIPLLIADISIIIQIASQVSMEEALQSDIDEDIAQFITSENNIDLSRTIVHEIKRDREWIALETTSTSPESFGGGALLVLRKQNESYQTVYFGTNYDKSSLIKIGIPDRLASDLSSNEITGRFSRLITNSIINPHNKYTFINQLPYKADGLTITYSFKDGYKDSDGTSIPIIVISGIDASERNNALSKIRNYDFDPGNYYIEFTNVNNPFIGKE